MISEISSSVLSPSLDGVFGNRDMKSSVAHEEAGDPATSFSLPPAMEGPMAQPATPLPPVGGPPASPPPYPPPYYPTYYPPPVPARSTDPALIIIVVVILLVGGTIVASAILYIMVSGLIPGGPDGRVPLVIFFPVTLQGGLAIVQVANVSDGATFDQFQANLRVNATLGTPARVSPSFAITVGTDTYPVTFVDRNGNGRLDSLDEFRITAPAGWRPGVGYQFELLWTDLRPIAFANWTG